MGSRTSCSPTSWRALSRRCCRRSQLLGAARSKARCSWVGAPEYELDPRALAVAVRTCFQMLAEKRPLVLAVDDIQWVDSSSASALVFALRRLRSERMLLLLARRLDERGEGPAVEEALEPDAVERLRVGPLSIGAIHTLLQRRLGRPFARPTLRRLQEISGGNPFYALELARGLGSAGATVDSLEPFPGSGDAGAAGGRPPGRARRTDARGVAPRCRARQALTLLSSAPPGPVRTRSSRRSQRKWSSSRPTRSDSPIRCSRRSSTRSRPRKSGEKLMDASPRS